MVFRLALFSLLLLCCLCGQQIGLVEAFASPPTVFTRSTTATRSLTSDSTIATASSSSDDCGCQQPVLYGGEPSTRAKSLNHYEVIRNLPFQRVSGEIVTMDELLFTAGEEKLSSKDDPPVAIAVFLRSLGWPLCQEYILQWSQRLPALQQQQQQQQQTNIRLILISIGKPHVGKDLIQHLELQELFTNEYLFVDPDNTLYDALDLNRGIQRTFFNINTPFSFLDRFTKENGTKELGTILQKWTKALYMPPKQEQALLQGGTFVFAPKNKQDGGMDTLFAHYDPSTAAHASIDQVLDIAQEAAAETSSSISSE